MDQLGLSLAPVEEMIRDFLFCVGDKDPNRLVELVYAENATLLPPNHPRVSGRAAIAEYWARALQAGLSGFELEPKETGGSAGLLYILGTYQFQLERPEGDAARDRGKFLIVCRRAKDGRLRALIHMFNSDQAATLT